MVMARAMAVPMSVLVSVRVPAGMPVILPVVVVVVMIRGGRMILPGMIIIAVLHIHWFTPFCGRPARP